jgi:hypothetical protein
MNLKNIYSWIWKDVSGRQYWNGCNRAVVVVVIIILADDN